MLETAVSTIAENGLFPRVIRFGKHKMSMSPRVIRFGKRRCGCLGRGSLLQPKSLHIGTRPLARQLCSYITHPGNNSRRFVRGTPVIYSTAREQQQPIFCWHREKKKLHPLSSLSRLRPRRRGRQNQKYSSRTHLKPARSMSSIIVCHAARMPYNSVKRTLLILSAHTSDRSDRS